MTAIIHKCHFCKSNAVTRNVFNSYVCSTHIGTQVCASCELSIDYSIYSVVDGARCQRCKDMACLGVSPLWLAHPSVEKKEFPITEVEKKCNFDHIIVAKFDSGIDPDAECFFEMD